MDKKETAHVGARIPLDLFIRMESARKDLNRSRNYMIESALKYYLDSIENDNKPISTISAPTQDLESDIDLLKERIKKLEKVIEVSNALQNTLVKNPDLFQEVFERATGLKIRIVDE